MPVLGGRWNPSDLSLIREIFEESENMLYTFNSRGALILSVRDIAFSPDGLQVASVLTTKYTDPITDSTITYDALRVWLVSDGTLRKSIPNKNCSSGCSTQENRGLYAVDWSPDGTRLAIGGFMGVLRIYDAATFWANEIQGDEGPVLERWDGENTLDSRPAHGGHLKALAFTSGNRLVTVGYDLNINLWDAGSLSEVRADRAEAHLGRITSVAVSPDGVRFVTGAAHQSNPVKLWSTDKLPAETIVTKADTNRITSMSLLPDGKLISTGGHVGVVTLWGMPESGSMKRLMGVQGGTFAASRIATTPDGARAVSIGTKRDSGGGACRRLTRDAPRTPEQPELAQAESRV